MSTSTSDASRTAGDQSTGQLVARLSREISDLVRDEWRLAQVELTEKAKKAGIGTGMFGAAGLLAVYGVGVLIATAILAMALVMSPWLAALIVGVVLLVIAGVVALLGKRRVAAATPPIPEQTIASVKRDAGAVARHRAH